MCPLKHFDLCPLKIFWLNCAPQNTAYTWFTPLFVINYFFVAITRILGGTFCSNLVVRGTKTFYATGPGGPEEAKYQVKVSGDHDSNPVRPIGSSWDQIWSPGALRVPMGPPKRALLGALECRRGLLRGPWMWYGCVPEINENSRSREFSWESASFFLARPWEMIL